MPYFSRLFWHTLKHIRLKDNREKNASIRLTKIVACRVLKSLIYLREDDGELFGMAQPVMDFGFWQRCFGSLEFAGGIRLVDFPPNR